MLLWDRREKAVGSYGALLLTVRVLSVRGVASVCLAVVACCIRVPWWYLVFGLSITLSLLQPRSVRFYEHGARFTNMRWIEDQFVPWDQWDRYYWDNNKVWLVRKAMPFQTAQQRGIRVAAAKRNELRALLSARL